MSFLAPLYLAGLLAISAPLIFHLIRRTPKGQLPFSSVMFLSPSPPRLTKRSRLDNLVLLLLRAAAILLLAIAFARPFLRASSTVGLMERSGRRVAILVDTSASMRRDGLWEQAVTQVDQVLDALDRGDDVALYRYDAKLEAVVPFDETAPIDPARKVPHAQAAIRQITPGWAGSNLGDAMITLADDLHRLGQGAEDIHVDRQIVLVTDLQEGSRVDSLGTYQWPDDVQLTVHAVEPLAPTNAGLHRASVLEETAASKDQGKIRVRVTNDRGSTEEQFQLHWEDATGTIATDEPTQIYVPQGESRVLRVPRPADVAAFDRLILSGDDHAFDNRLHLAPIRQESVSVLYLGDEKAEDPAGLLYYLIRAFPETAKRKTEVTAYPTSDPILATDATESRLIVVGRSLSEGRVTLLRNAMQGGGTVLFLLTDQAQAESLAQLMGVEHLVVNEASGGDYAMLGEIAFRDPLFSTFADTRYNDFTKIQFWHHRELDLPEDVDATVLARFDDGHIALLEQRHEAGRLMVLTAGWHPADSQLARSTKFVPLLAGMLERSGRSDFVEPQYEVGAAVLLPTDAEPQVERSVTGPDGTDWKLAADATTFGDTMLPGIYALSTSEQSQPFAVNVPQAESRTDALAVDALGEHGVLLGQPPGRAELEETMRQMRDVELEGRQKLWRWLIVVAIAILAVETWLAGYLTRRSLLAVEAG